MREPWLPALGQAVASGALGVDAPQATRTGLGRPSSTGRSTGGIGAAQLGGAVLTPLAEAPGLHADALLVRARQLRDELDVAGVAQREHKLRDERSIRRYRRANGLSRYVVDADVEPAAFLDDL